MFFLSCIYLFRLMDSVMRMEAWTKQLHFCFTTTSPHCLDGIQCRWLQCLLFQLLHSYSFTFYVIRELKVTILLSYSSKYFLPIPTGITTIFLSQQCHKQCDIMFVVSTGILFRITVYCQFSYLTCLTIVLILGNIDTESSPTAIIPYSRFVTVHKPMIFHRIGYMTIFYDTHGSTRNALIHWNSGMLFRHRFNVPSILSSHLGLFGDRILPIEPFG